MIASLGMREGQSGESHRSRVGQKGLSQLDISALLDEWKRMRLGVLLGEPISHFLGKRYLPNVYSHQGLWKGSSWVCPSATVMRNPLNRFWDFC